jgi:uncharacterized membrane protein SpoIIM required for sporulation
MLVKNFKLYTHEIIRVLRENKRLAFKLFKIMLIFLVSGYVLQIYFLSLDYAELGGSGFTFYVRLPDFTKIFFRNLSTITLIMFSSILHLGLLAVFLVTLGIGIGIGSLMAEGTYFLKCGPLAALFTLIPHGVFELLAYFFASALSLKVGFSVIKPPEGKTRLEAIKVGYKDMLILYPLLVLLLLIAALIESKISIPLLKAFVSR